MRSFQEEQRRLAAEQGYIVTLAGRPWPIGGLGALDPQIRSNAERMARHTEGTVEKGVVMPGKTADRKTPARKTRSTAVPVDAEEEAKYWREHFASRPYVPDLRKAS